MMNVQAPVKADRTERLRLAREEAYATPLKDFHPGAPRLFRDDTLWPWFERLRKEEPVHYCSDRALLVGGEIQRHHACRHQSRHLLLRRAAWRHFDQGQPARL